MYVDSKDQMQDKDVTMFHFQYKTCKKSWFFTVKISQKLLSQKYNVHVLEFHKGHRRTTFKHSYQQKADSKENRIKF